MNEHRIWIAAYEQDGEDLTQIKIDGGLMTDRHAAHAKAWLDKRRGESPPPARPRRWRSAFTVGAAIATALGAASTLALMTD